MIVTVNGPIDARTISGNVLLFESLLFDRSGEFPSASATRLSLENRWQMLASPDAFLDNITSSLDLFEFELKNLSLPPNSLLCMHSNDLLLSGSKEVVKQFKEIVARSSVRIVLAIGLPPRNLRSSTVDPTEYLVSHVHYGMKGGLLFGLLGPVLVTRDTDMADLAPYLEAQKKTGASLLVEVQDGDAPVLQGQVFDANKTAFFFPVNSEPSLQANTWSGCRYKSDFKKFGGAGICFSSPIIDSTRALLSFDWNPPLLDSTREENNAKWICDICKKIERVVDQPNYTKLGFTYCSSACLAVHRKRGFLPV